jgi:uncharacterized protein (TIGR01777 family)
VSSREYVRRSSLPFSAERAFAWHERPGALERLTPPFAPVRVLARSGEGIRPGARVVLRIPLGPAGVTWVAEHRDYVPGRLFRDVMVQGPFARWDHTHRFLPEGPAASVLEDRVLYELPGGALGDAVGRVFVPAMLAGMFGYRHRVTAGDLASHARCEEGRALSVLVTGSSGLIGSALVPFLTTGGHRVVRLVRGGSSGAPDTAGWDPGRGVADAAALDGLDAAVHLAGEPIAATRWTPAVRARIHDSRVGGTQRLCEDLAGLPRPPRVLVSASAIGIYGDRGDTACDETTPPGAGFLADVCRDWEAATEPARRAGIRVVLLRIGVVLSPLGGALGRLLPVFRLGAGGVAGDGRQWTSWIGVDDVLGAIHHALVTDGLAGPVNAVAPEPATNRELTATLARVLGRPALMRIPAAALRLAVGEMARETVLASTRVVPTALEASGYHFRTPGLEATLRHLLGR